MGQSTDAILFYGYTWQDQESLETIDGEEIDTYDLGESDLAKTHGVGVDSHCSCEYAIPFIHIAEAHVTAYRGDSQSIDVSALADSPTDEWDKRLYEFIQDANINMAVSEHSEPVKGPGWFLVSNWC